MLIHTTARHCDLDADLRAFAEQRLGKFEKFARDIREVHLIVTGEKFRSIAEITLRLNHHELVSKQAADEMKMAIDQAADGIEQQLRRFKEKRVERGRRGRGDGGVAAAPAGADEEAEED